MSNAPLGVPSDRPFPFKDPTLAKMAHAGRVTQAKMQMAVPTSTGIGAPGTAPAPASLARSPMNASGGAAPAASIPFTRGSTLATMRDATRNYTAGQSDQVQLQTNAFLENIIVDLALPVSANVTNSVTYQPDSPWSIIAQIKLDDPAGQSIIAPITGYHLYLLNKYLPDVECFYDPKRDPNYQAVTGTGGTAGTIGFRLVIPVEHRRRDALGAVNNSAANQRYLLTYSLISSFATTGVGFLYTVAPSAPATIVYLNFYQQYWTSPPGTITTAQGSAQVQQSPTGLGSVGFVRYERHNEVNGGGSPQIQFNNVGDYISGLIFVLRTNTNNARDIYVPPQSATNANWSPEFDWWINDFQVHALSIYGPNGTAAATGIGGAWPRGQARFYGNNAAVETAGGPDNGVFSLFQLYQLFDGITNFGPANQYLPTDATTKLQIRGSTFGSGAQYIEVLTRMIRPVSGAALFA